MVLYLFVLLNKISQSNLWITISFFGLFRNIGNVIELPSEERLPFDCLLNNLVELINILVH